MGDEQSTVGAILTPSQRGFLRGERDIDPEGAHARTTRSRIRARLRAALPDSTLILRELPVDDIQQALEPRSSPDEPGVAEMDVELGLSSAIAIIYLACLSRDPGGEHPAWWPFKQQVEKGIRRAHNARGESLRGVTAIFEIEPGAEFEALADLAPAELAELSEPELLQARLEEALSREQFLAAMEAKGRTVDHDVEEE